MLRGMWHGHGAWRLVSILSAAIPAAAEFQVLDVGAPRTGTQTLQAALEILGLHTLHTGENETARLPWCGWLLSGKKTKAPVEMLNDYNAAMDEPMQLIYPQVVEAYPKAKFIYTLRDPETWFASYDSVMYDLITEASKERKQTNRRLRQANHVPPALYPLMDAVENVTGKFWHNCNACDLAQNLSPFAFILALYMVYMSANTHR